MSNITQEQIDQYIEGRNEDEMENRQFYNERSYWGELTQAQKVAEATQFLETQSIMESGKCPYCGCEETKEFRGMVGEIDTFCAGCDALLYSDFNIGMIL